MIVNLMYDSPDGTSELVERIVIPMNVDPVRPWQRKKPPALATDIPR
jgi:hypothetical protein